jgi:site-specific DNA-methyltransferase (adenine-specific)
VFSRKSDEYITPEWLYDKLNWIYELRLDPTTTRDNPLNTEFYYTKADNGLNKDWEPVNTFINPPYSQVGKWAAKANEQFLVNLKKNPQLTIVMLVAARTDSRWFHDIVITANLKKYYKIHFFRGRLKFRNTEYSSPFPLMLIAFRIEVFD